MEIQKTSRKMKPARGVLGKVRAPKTGADEDLRRIEFSYFMPDAKQVCVAGTFNDWDTESMPLKKNKEGNWSSAVNLAPGRYEYNFFVDGEWTSDPTCSESVGNAFGTSNCVINVE